MPSRHFKQADKHLCDLGWTFDRINSKGWHIYTHTAHHEVSINPSIDERSWRSIKKQTERACGVEQTVTKRNPAAVKERQAAEREALKAEQERLEAERAQILANRDRQLEGLGAVLTPVEVRAITERIEEIDRRHREIDALMRGTPATNNGTRRSRHEAGHR